MAFLLCFGYLAASPARIYDSGPGVTMISFVRACLENTQVKVWDVVIMDLHATAREYPS